MLIGARHLQNIHPLVTHFPIGLLISATLFYFAAWVFKKDDLAKAGFWVLLLGALSLAVAMGTGLYAEDGVMVALDVRQELLLPHKQYMIATAVLCVITTLWALVQRPFPKKVSFLFLGLLFAMVFFMTIGADFGGRLVYDYNAGGSLPQPIKFNQ